MTDIVTVEVSDLARYRLRITFTDGVVCEVDLTERLRDGGPVFRRLYDNPTLFSQVFVDPDASTIVWPTGADLAPEALRDGRYAVPASAGQR